MKKVTVVIPARNEGDSIGQVIKELKEVNGKYELGKLSVLVVDDSRDRTSEIARRLGANVIRGEGKSLGSAMFLGIKRAAADGADVIASIDADGQFDPQEMPQVVGPVLEGRADLVLGSRYLGKNRVEYRMPIINKIGNRALSWMVSKITGLKITDAQTGYRAMTREVAEALEMIGSHTYVQETIIDAHEKNFRILEVPARFRKREHGGSKVVSSVKRYALYTFPVLVLRAGVHMMLLPVIGALISAAGVLYGFGVLYQQGFSLTGLLNRVPALLLTVLLISVGAQLFFSGIILNLLIRAKYGLDKLTNK